MSFPVNPRAARLTDDQLRADLQAGLKPIEIARRHGISRSAVSQRVKQLNLTTTSALVAPQESVRHVRQSFDVMEQLRKNLVGANLLMDACDQWLRDADDPTRYDLGARHDEIEVTYTVEIETQTGFRTEKRKKKLSHLMACLEGYDDDGARFFGWRHGEVKRADPRELILKTQNETRQTAALIINAIQELTNSLIMAEFRRSVIEEVAKESPDCAARIEERLQRTISTHAAFARAGTVPPPGGGDLN